MSHVCASDGANSALERLEDGPEDVDVGGGAFVALVWKSRAELGSCATKLRAMPMVCLMKRMLFGRWYHSVADDGQGG